MCALSMFNQTTINSAPIMNFEPPIKQSSTSHLLSSSPFSASSLQINHHQLSTLDQNVNSLNSSNLNASNQMLPSSFSPNSRSPPYSMDYYYNGKQPDNMKIEYKKKAKSCMICGDAAFYFFYGSLCCDACRTFFRRSSLQNSKHLKCPFNGKCVINTRTRKDCSKCRLEKCLEVGMRQDLIVNAKEERKRKQSISLYDLQFNAAVASAPNHYVSNSFTNNYGLSAIQNEYDQYLQSCLNYERITNAYYMHNTMSGFNTNLLNSLKNSSTSPGYSTAATQKAQSSANPLDTLNQLDSLNSLNQLNYQSSINSNPFLFSNANENSNSSLDAGSSNYMSNDLLSAQTGHHMQDGNASIFSNIDQNRADDLSANGFLPQNVYSKKHCSSSSRHFSSNSLPTNSSLSTHLLTNRIQNQNNPLSSMSNYGLDDCLRNQFPGKESKTNLDFLNKLSESDSEEMARQIRKLSFATSNDDNAKDGFDRHSNEFDKIDFNKLDLNKSNLPSSSSSSCSSLSSSYASPPNNTFNLFDFEQAKLLNANNYNWKKRKIQFLTDEEIEKENRKFIRTLARQNQMKKQRMEEIYKVSKRVMKTPDYKLNDCKLGEGNTIGRSHLLEALRWIFFGITKLCKSFQEITAYKQLEEIEKKQLLMANCTYILMLSSTKYYNFETKSWDVNVKLNNQGEIKKIKMPVSVEVMNDGSKKQLASSYIKFMEILDRSWLEDETLMTLIFVICLFTPDEKLIKKMNSIGYEHECYLNLLEDYLEKKLMCREKAKSQKNLIKKFLIRLTEFKVEFEEAHVVLAKEETFQLYDHLLEQLSV